ncbi:DUF2382 domain-containing protein [Telmatospirillum sp. J64-1]|uniref:DUF2382 domain-containing protein n=1 Tax=Telmatospirillum sp. J64-1 TaxID=2502183 RepID=UPI00115D54D3|nr:DUF2382 domain-containing protein [Telmatospirillum sp. J64-1]
MAKTIVGLYHGSVDAQQVLHDLVENGFSRDDISYIIPQQGDAAARRAFGTTTSVEPSSEDSTWMSSEDLMDVSGIGPVLVDGRLKERLSGGENALIESLESEGVPEEDARAYGEGVKNGECLVVLHSSDDQVSTGADIMNRRHASHMEDQPRRHSEMNEIDSEEERRDMSGTGLAGGTGMVGGAGMVGSTGMENRGSLEGRSNIEDETGIEHRASLEERSSIQGDTGMESRSGMTEDRTSLEGNTGLGSDTGLESDTGTEGGRLEAAKEELEISKRKVSDGETHVRSHVVETPVEESISLRQERAEIERKAVDKEVEDNDDLFQERDISVTESHEEPVIHKQAHVVEEVDVKKVATTEQRKVRDKLRETKIDVEKGPGSRKGYNKPN